MNQEIEQFIGYQIQILIAAIAGMSALIMLSIFFAVQVITDAIKQVKGGAR